jgi:putative sugar O-methyltransferase
VNNYEELNAAYCDMLEQNELYKPTHFWQEASSKIISEINTYGIERFRSMPIALSFFVPTYGIPGGGVSKQQIEALKTLLNNNWPLETKLRLIFEKFTSGQFSALSDYRVFKASDNSKVFPYLHKFTESKIGEPIEQFEFDGQTYSRSSLNYLLGLAFLKKHLLGEVPLKVLEVGGGFGTLGEILASSSIPEIQYIDVDIPPTNFVAQYYLQKIFGKKNVLTYAETSHCKQINIEKLPKFSVLCSWQIEKLVGEIDLFVNFISFQEMEPQVVKNYLDNVVRLGARWILLRNMKEGKNVANEKKIGVINPITGDDYISMLPDYELVERNVIPFGFETADGFNSELILLKLKN